MELENDRVLVRYSVDFEEDLGEDLDERFLFFRYIVNGYYRDRVLIFLL